MNQHGLGGMIDAGQICRQAEIILPDLFRAVSVRKTLSNTHILHLELPKRNLISLKMREGLLLKELNLYADSQKLPRISRLRLTFSAE